MIVAIIILILILRIWGVLKTSVASMTSTDMIKLLASMTSTASLASKNEKIMHFICWVISLASGTSAASVTSTASVTSMTSTALLHQKNYWAWCFHQPWHQNDLLWSLNVGFNHQKLNILFYFGILSFGGCGGQGYYFWPNQRVISQMSTTQDFQITLKQNLACISLSVKANWNINVCPWTPCSTF